VASILGELAAGIWRVPVDLVKQRQQAGGGQRLGAVVQGVVSTQGSIFVASLQDGLAGWYFSLFFFLMMNMNMFVFCCLLLLLLSVLLSVLLFLSL